MEQAIESLGLGPGMPARAVASAAMMVGGMEATDRQKKGLRARSKQGNKVRMQPRIGHTAYQNKAFSFML